MTVDSKRPGTMGRKDYKGTILDGRDSFDSWKMDLEDSLLSDDLMSYVTVKATAGVADNAKAPTTAEDIKNTSLARMKIRQSIDQIHKNSINTLPTRARFINLSSNDTRHRIRHASDSSSVCFTMLAPRPTRLCKKRSTI